ncbi:MAG: hypothetical protein HY301_17965 [Verrucomicrobia bacterium]|nr:hypothetical protein [Verrucomicrobiota bacterium]
MLATLGCLAVLVCLNSNCCRCKWLDRCLPGNKGFFIQAFFWAALGSALSGWKYYLDDKEDVHKERLKDDPNLIHAGYPTYKNIFEYGFNLVFAGALGILGIAVLLAGLGAFNATEKVWTMKEKTWLVVYCVLIGMYPKAFLGWMLKLRDQFIRSKGDDKDEQKEKSDKEEKEKQDKLKEAVAQLRAQLTSWVKKDDNLKKAAVKWIEENYPPQKRDVAQAGLDYKDPEIFIAHPPGKNEKEILQKLLDHLKSAQKLEAAPAAQPAPGATLPPEKPPGAA